VIAPGCAEDTELISECSVESIPGMIFGSLMFIIPELPTGEEEKAEAVLQEVRDCSDRVAWGTGRVAFRANFLPFRRCLMLAVP
jgi:hypothetical protein